MNEKHFILPYNIHFRYNDNFVKQLLIYDNKLVNVLIYEIKK